MSNHIINSKALFNIISDAKQNMANLKLPMEVSGIKMEECDFRAIAVIEALTMYLNRNKLLKNLVEIDYTDTSCQYESNEE